MKYMCNYPCDYKGFSKDNKICCANCPELEECELACYDDPKTCHYSEPLRKFEAVSKPFYGKEVVLPVRKTKGSAGYDFITPIGFVFLPGTRFTIWTGVKALIPEGEYLQLVIRSSLATKKGLILCTSGVIDADYYNNPDNEGEIGVTLLNVSDRVVEIKAGERICQGIFLKYGTTFDDDVTEERVGGYGSTGK